MKTRVMNQTTLLIFAIIVSMCVIRNVGYAANPAFTEGSSTTRSVAEDAGWNAAIGTAISATDADNDIDFYYISDEFPSDYAWFTIDANTGQLRRSIVLDYELRKTLRVYVVVRDDDGNEDSIKVTINVTNVDEPPKFNIHSKYRSISERIGGNTNVGAPITAVDDANDTPTYSLGGTNANLFRINSTTGQLRTAPVVNFDYETQPHEYEVTVTATESSQVATTTVMISVTNNNEYPIFPTNFQSSHTVTGPLSEGDTVGDQPDLPDDPDLTATNNDPNPSRNGLNKLKYRLIGQNAVLFSIDQTTGQLSAATSVAAGNYLVGVILSDESLTRNKNVTINVQAGNQEVDPVDLTDNVGEGSSPVQEIPDPSTWMPDANLRTAVSKSLGLSNDEILTQDKLATLNELKAAGREISDITGVEHATNLTIARFAGNQISNISALSKLTSLTILRLQGNQISDISGLSELTNLTELFLNGNQITDITPLAGLSNLENLTLSGNPFTNTGANAQTLTTLNTAGVTLDVTVGNNAPSLTRNTDASDETLLLANYPNPSNPETWIPYQLAKPADVTITIYNMRGVVVRKLALGHQPAGFYHSRSRAAYWNGKNEFGERVASGVYFYMLKVGNYTATRKMLIRK